MTTGAATAFCFACGAAIGETESICRHCGLRQRGVVRSIEGASPKKIILVWIFGWFLGPLGGHRFYLGRPASGGAIAATCLLPGLLSGSWVGWVLGLLAASLWWIVDFILLLTGSLTDGDGRKVVTWD